MQFSLMSAPAIAHGTTPPPTATPSTPPSSPATPTSTALAQAKKDNRRIEIESLRSENATYYANPDGKTVRMELYLEPIRVKNAKGDGFTPIDTTLVEADGVIKPKAAKDSLILSAGDNTEVIRSKSGDVAAQIDAPHTLPKPKLNGSTATYSSAYGKGIDLVVTATPTGFRQRIVIRQRPAGPMTFRVPMNLPKGISFGKNTKGQPTLESDNGKHRLDIRPAALLDAAAANANADLDAVRVGRAQVSLDGSALVYSPDPVFLADPATTFPVTMTAADDDWWDCTLGDCPDGVGESMDTYINDVDLTDSWDMHYRDQMWVGKSYSSSIAKRWRAYIQFPLPRESDPFWNSTIQNADLELWNYLSNDCGDFVGSGITARRVTSDWDHLTLQWNDQPSVTNLGADTEYGAYSTDCSGSMNYEHDLIHSVDAIVQEWADGETNYGFQLRAGDESELRNWRRYRTREQTSGYPAHGPRLTVDFMPAQRVRMAFGFDHRPASMPTYDEAAAAQIEPGTEGLPPMTVAESLAYDGSTGAPYEVRVDKLQPLDGSTWTAADPEVHDDEPPAVTATEPAAGADHVPLHQQIQVTFSEPVENAELVVKNAVGAQVAGTTSMDSDKRILSFAPSAPLAEGTTYTAEVSKALDLWENEMVAHTWTFTTVDSGERGRWTFDEGTGEVAADSSSHKHDATLATSAQWVEGKIGKAVSNLPSAARAAASATAVKQGKAVEVAEETTATSVTYAQPDGKTFKTEATAGPVRTRQGPGWAPIDTSLAEQGGKLRPKNLADGAVVEISAGGTDPFVKMTADGKSYALRWPTPLPKPTVKGSVATYIDAGGVGADLVVTALPAGFRHEVVLRQRPAKQVELRIGVEDGGLTLSEGKGGRLLLKGKNNKLVATGTRPTVSDSGTKDQPASVKHSKTGADMVTKDGRTELVVKPDQTFLADAATTYPVRVAASVTLPLSTDVDVSTNDSDVSPAYPGNQYMLAGTVSGGTKARVHLRFDTSGLQGSTVTDATLSMNTIDSHNCGPALSRGIQVARLTAGWDPDNLYWDNKPAFTTEDASTNFKGVDQTCGIWPDSMDWNVTGIAQDWAAGAANHGLVLKSPGEADVNNYRVFTSSEDTDFTQPPTLTVTTSGPTSQPAVSAPAITPAHTVNDITVTSSLTPQLAATVTDPADGNLTAQFEVEHDPAATTQGSGQIWTGTSPATPAGGQATVSVPTGKLTDGWKIRWRARAANATASTTSAWTDWQSATVDVPNPTVGAFQVTPSQVVDGVTVATSLTPGLRATVTDPAAQTLRAEFEVEHDPAAPSGQGSGQIWTGAVDGVASGTQAAATVPDGKLTDGWQVRWRIRAVNTATMVGSPWSDWQNLTVDVPDPVSEPTVGALQVNPSQQVDGTTVVPTLTPSLLVQVNDPAGGTLRAEAEVEHDPAAPAEQGTGRIWAGNADNVLAGTQATIPVPADTLTDGWKARWRARAVSATDASAWTDWQSFTIDLPKPTATGLTITPSTVVDGVTVTTTSTPTLKATVTHPTGQPLRAEAEIEHDPAAPAGQGDGQIWTGAVENVASGTQAGLTVPDGKLTNGWKIRWRLRAVSDQAPSAWSDWQQVTVDVTQPGEEPLAQTAGPVIRTDQSFTAAAWLRWSDKDGDYTVAEQKGTHQAPFRLGNTPDRGLVFTFTDADTVDATIEGVLTDVEPPVGEWFHLAGVYDAMAKTASLYLNGSLIKSEPLTVSPWHADAPMTLGTSMQGDLDETRAYQRSLSVGDIAALHASGFAVPAAPAKTGPLSSAAPAAQATSGGAIPGFDYERHNLQTCNAKLIPSGQFYTAEGFRELRPYSGCWTKWLGWGEWEIDRKKSIAAGRPIPVPDVDDAVVAEVTIVMHTYLGDADGSAVIGDDDDKYDPRQITVFTEVKEVRAYDDGEPTTAFDSDYMKLQVTAAAAEDKDSGPCVKLDGDDRRTQVRNWKNATMTETYVFESKPKTNDPDSVDVCEISPILIYEDRWGPIDGEIALWNKPERRPYRYSQVPRVRCDNKKMGNKVGQANDYRHKKACIFGSANRILTLSLSDRQITGAAHHNSIALHNPELTVPKLLDGNGNELRKQIPGNYGPGNSPAGDHLERGTASPAAEAKAWADANRNKIAAPCRQERTRIENEGGSVAGMQCDEFPYASSKQGAKDANGHFSIKYIPTGENNMHGRYLSAFYSRYRVGTDNKFWVRIVE